MDGANVRIHQGDNNEATLTYNEVDTYVNCRYVSFIEAAWRLNEFPLQDKSHSIIRLAIHEERDQSVVFRVGHV